MMVLVSGGRDYSDHVFVARVLDGLHHAHRLQVVIHGCAKGADTLAGEWAQRVGVREAKHPASWRTDQGEFDRSAGTRRNQQMRALLDWYQRIEKKRVLGVCFPGGHGTGEMVKGLATSGIPFINLGVRAARDQFVLDYPCTDPPEEEGAVQGFRLRL